MMIVVHNPIKLEMFRKEMTSIMLVVPNPRKLKKKIQREITPIVIVVHNPKKVEMFQIDIVPILGFLYIHIYIYYT